VFQLTHKTRMANLDARFWWPLIYAFIGCQVLVAFHISLDVDEHGDEGASVLTIGVLIFKLMKLVSVLIFDYPVLYGIMKCFFIV